MLEQLENYYLVSYCPAFSCICKWCFTGSMALMDAGIPVREHVAGVSVGLVSQVDPTTGDISDYRIVTDILVRVLMRFIQRPIQFYMLFPE